MSNNHNNNDDNSNDTNDNFLAKAQAATQRVVAAASAATQQSATPQQASFVQALAQDRPTIQSAVTSFLSLVAARSLVTPEVLAKQQQQYSMSSNENSVLLVLTNAQALQCSRILLRAINDTTICAVSSSSSKLPTTKHNNNNKDKEEEEYDLVAQVWNGLVASEQKPARFLGRRALRHAWTDVLQHDSLAWYNNSNRSAKMTTTTTTAAAAASTLPANDSNTNTNTNDNDPLKDHQQQQHEQQHLLRFVQEFERLLFYENSCITTTSPDEDEQDDDAALIWSVDKGKAELQRRRDRRQKRATCNATKEDDEGKGQTKEEDALPFIEELVDEK